jgi:hypothetical protein
MRQEWSSHGGSTFERFDRMDRCIDRHGRMNVANSTVVWTSLGPLPRWVPGPTTRWAPETTRLVPHGT